MYIDIKYLYVNVVYFVGLGYRNFVGIDCFYILCWYIGYFGVFFCIYSVWIVCFSS